MESINKFFIHNGEVKNSESFNDENVKGKTCLYEVLRVINSKPLFLEDHLQRLISTAKLIKKELLLNKNEIIVNLLTLIDKNKIEEGNIKIVLNYDTNNSYFYFIKHSYPKDNDYKIGVKTITINEERENPNAKIVNSSLREKTNKLLKENDAYEGILIDREGFIREGSRSNIFLIKGNLVITAPDELVLKGITRTKVINILENNNIKLVKEKMKAEEIKNVDALFLCGTSPKILPINKVDNVEFNSPNNKILITIMDNYNNEINEDINNFENK